MCNPLSGLGVSSKTWISMCFQLYYAVGCKALLSVGGNPCFHQVLFRPFFRTWIIWDLWGCPSPPLQVVPTWIFCSSQPPCLCKGWEGWRLHSPGNTDPTKPKSSPGGQGYITEAWRKPPWVWRWKWRIHGEPHWTGTFSNHTCQAQHLRKCHFFLKTFRKRSPFWKLHFFFQRTSENTDFYLFVLFSILSYILLFPFHFQCLDSPVLPVRENVPLSGKFQGCVWVKRPRDVWPWACWNRTLIHSEQPFLFCVAVPEKFLVSACAVSNVSHSKHSLCFLAHKTAEVHPVQWTNYSALSRYLC